MYSNNEEEDLSISFNLSKNAFLMIESRKYKHHYEHDNNFTELETGEVIIDPTFKLNNVQLIKNRYDSGWFEYWKKYNARVISQSSKTFYAAEEKFEFEETSKAK
ncbi:hypothetical protein [Acinetobacter larvae]|uniref:Uncharacterized protein n=1 Tax=Acinetobacter larvae TaxID=1789224 RepID=A0A1B2LZF0_9GAMM|nr:hypothetical protein [Acinetobacter larvae]AOA58314.1 hypothetical protein BFG52_08040 [Acinetobacter larvae]